MYQSETTDVHHIAWLPRASPLDLNRQGRRSVSNIGGGHLSSFKSGTGGCSCPLFGSRGEAPARQAIWSTSEVSLWHKSAPERHCVCQIFEYSNHISHKMPLYQQCNNSFWEPSDLVHFSGLRFIQIKQRRKIILTIPTLLLMKCGPFSNNVITPFGSSGEAHGSQAMWCTI